MAYKGGSCKGALRKGGSGVMKGGGGRDSPIPTEPLHPMKSGQTDITDGVERGHGRVAGQDAHIVPPLGLHCLTFKRKVTAVSPRLTGGKVVTDGNDVHPHGALNKASGGVDGTEAGLGFAQWRTTKGFASGNWAFSLGPSRSQQEAQSQSHGITGTICT